MVSKEPSNRPSCAELLEMSKEWTVDRNTVTSDENYSQFSIIIESNEKLKILKKLI